MNHIPQPPSSLSGPLRDYLVKLAEYVNAQPTFSFFSGATPNSVVTGQAGSLALNLDSSSTLSRLWINTAPPSSGATRLGWVIVRVLAP